MKLTKTGIYIIIIIIIVIILISIIGVQAGKINKFRSEKEAGEARAKKARVLLLDSLSNVYNARLQDSISKANSKLEYQIKLQKNESTIQHKKNSSTSAAYDSIYVNRPDF